MGGEEHETFSRPLLLVFLLYTVVMKGELIFTTKDIAE